MEDFINRFAEVRFEEDFESVITGEGQGVILMPGTPDELEQYWRGQDTWVYADEMLLAGIV